MGSARLYSIATKALGYWFYTFEGPEGGNLIRFCMSYLMLTRYKLRKSSPNKNTISMLLFALSRLKIKEISYFKRKTLEKPAMFLQTACSYCNSKRDQNGTKTPAKPVFSRGSQTDSLRMPSLMGTACGWAIKATCPCSDVQWWMDNAMS